MRPPSTVFPPARVAIFGGALLTSCAPGATAPARSSAGTGGAPAPSSIHAASSHAVVAYASGYGPSIQLLSVDATTGALTPKTSFPSFGPAPSFLAIDPGVTNLYALDESKAGQVGAYRIDASTGALTFLDAVSSGGDGPAHLSVDASGRFVLVANYGDGTVSVLPVDRGHDGALGPAVETLQVGAQAHMILTDPSNRFALVPCKGVDYVAVFRFDAATGRLSPNAVPRVPTARGAGPRHLAFHPNGRFVYLINELDNTLTAYGWDAREGTLAPIETQSTLPVGFSGTGTAAEVWVHPSGAWVVGSNRGDDSLVVFAVDPASGKMTLRGHTKTGGAAPRDFASDRAGSFLYVANQKSSALTAFRFDASRGTLSPTTPALPVASPSFIGLATLP